MSKNLLGIIYRKLSHVEYNAHALLPSQLLVTTACSLTAHLRNGASGNWRHFHSWWSVGDISFIYFGACTHTDATRCMVYLQFWIHSISFTNIIVQDIIIVLMWIGVGPAKHQQIIAPSEYSIIALFIQARNHAPTPVAASAYASCTPNLSFRDSMTTCLLTSLACMLIPPSVQPALHMHSYIIWHSIKHGISTPRMKYRPRIYTEDVSMICR